MIIGRIPPLGVRRGPRARSVVRRVVPARPILGVRGPRGRGVLLRDRWMTQVLCAVWSVLRQLRTSRASRA